MLKLFSMVLLIILIITEVSDSCCFAAAFLQQIKSKILYFNYYSCYSEPLALDTILLKLHPYKSFFDTPQAYMDDDESDRNDMCSCYSKDHSYYISLFRQIDQE